jgi:DNA ligase 1
MNKTIYKRDSKGKVRFLTIKAEEGYVIQESGILGTDSPVVHRSACIGKNIGKTNSTTPEEQAVLEANSKITEKMRQGYFNTIEEASQLGGSDFVLPMLAEDFKKHKKKIVFPCYAQPKLDGMRALGKGRNTMLSRTGKIVDTITHINLPEVLENFHLDGELYQHEVGFQNLMRRIKKVGPFTKHIQYHVYDIVINDKPFHERMELLREIVGEREDIIVVETVLVNNEEELVSYHQNNLQKGYEGTMVRHGSEGYAVNKRSSQLLKYKDFLDEVYYVEDVVPSESRPEQGVVVCDLGNGMGPKITFNCGMKFSHEAREEILRNKHMYIGTMAEVRFFEFTDGGIPRFPVCVGFRLDK